MEEIIEERGEFRVRLELDTDAAKPEDAGQCPILQVIVKQYEGYAATEFNEQAAGFAYPFDRFITAFGAVSQHKAIRVFERYLRVFRGTKSFATYHLGYSREYGYIAFDTKAWLEEIGVTDENPDIEPVDRAEPCLDEIKAWAEGDVWGWIVERKVRWQRLGSDGEPVFLTEPNTMETWEEVSSCWGFYGRDYAESAAKEALAITIENEGN